MLAHECLTAFRASGESSARNLMPSMPGLDIPRILQSNCLVVFRSEVSGKCRGVPGGFDQSRYASRDPHSPDHHRGSSPASFRMLDRALVPSGGDDQHWSTGFRRRVTSVIPHDSFGGTHANLRIHDLLQRPRCRASRFILLRQWIGVVEQKYYSVSMIQCLPLFRAPESCLKMQPRRSAFLVDLPVCQKQLLACKPLSFDFHQHKLL
jgi:hypothetical protein